MASEDASYSHFANPFLQKLSLTKWQKLQILVMSFTIAPLRFIIAFVLFAITWFVAVIATCGADTSKPAVSIRKAVYQFLQFLGRVILFVCGFHHIKVTGKRASYKEAPILLVTPHSSFWDVTVLFVTSPLPCALSKYENFKIPIFGTLVKAIQPILVRRNDSESRRDTVSAISNRMSSVEDWPQLIVFPEGTCTNKKYMIKFKLGAFVAGQPIQPVVLKYKNAVDVSTWTEMSPGAFYLIWLSFCQIQLNLEVDFLPVYKPNEIERKDPKIFAQNVQVYMSKVLQLQCTDHSFEDRQLMKYAGKLNFPKEAAIIQFFRVSKTLNIKFDDAKERLKEFAGIPSSKRGVIDIESFSSFMNVPVSPVVRKIFGALSLGSDEVTFYQYIMVYYSFVNTLKKEPVLSNVYNLYCSFANSGSNNFKNDTALALTKVIKDCEIANKEEFLEFLLTHPFHCKLLMLLHEKPYFNSTINIEEPPCNLNQNSLHRRK